MGPVSLQQGVRIITPPCTPPWLDNNNFHIYVGFVILQKNTVEYKTVCQT